MGWWILCNIRFCFSGKFLDANGPRETWFSPDSVMPENAICHHWEGGRGKVRKGQVPHVSVNQGEIGKRLL